MVTSTLALLLLLCLITVAENAALGREGMPVYFNTGGRWRPGRPLKRSILLDHRDRETSVSDTLPPQAGSAGPDGAPDLGPAADAQRNPSIVFLPEVAGYDGPMLLTDGFGAGVPAPDGSGRALTPLEEVALFLSLNSGPSRLAPSDLAPPASPIPAATALSTAPRQ